jgi:hypothetical protein
MLTYGDDHLFCPSLEQLDEQKSERHTRISSEESVRRFGRRCSSEHQIGVRVGLFEKLRSLTSKLVS